MARSPRERRREILQNFRNEESSLSQRNNLLIQAMLKIDKLASLSNPDLSNGRRVERVEWRGKFRRDERGEGGRR